jgi:uroporphyrin-3 C-methyltransferase
MSETDTPSPDNATTAPSVEDAGDDKSAAGTAKSRHAAQQAKSGGLGYTLLMLVLLAGITGGGYFLWHKLEVAQQGLVIAAESAKQKLDTLTSRTQQLEQQVEALPGSISALQTQQQALVEAMGKLRSEANGGSRTWDVEEIAALLQIANDRLHLEDNVAVALAALQAADRHLEALKNPALLDTRRLVTEEITALRAIAAPDITGMALSLGALIEGIDRLPVTNGEGAKVEPTAAPAGGQGWRGVLNDLWEKLKALVVIKRRNEADPALLAPDERYFLRQNLRLNLESARIALLRHDSQSYQQTLRSAREWITLYFDNTAPAVAGTLKELDRLQQIDITPSLPDISGSLNALRAWQKRQQQQSAKVTPP